MKNSEIRVGLLAYGAIGDEHNQAVSAADGLVVTAVCDTNPERIAAALKIAPAANSFADADLIVRKSASNLRF